MSGRELLFSITKKDLEITHIRGSGAGGQHRNKVSTGIRMHHPASGVTVEATDDKSQLANTRHAFGRLMAHKDFQRWLRILCAELSGRPSIASEVERLMADEFIRTEVHDDQGRWVEVPVDQLTR